MTLSKTQISRLKSQRMRRNFLDFDTNLNCQLGRIVKQELKKRIYSSYRISKIEKIRFFRHNNAVESHTRKHSNKVKRTLAYLMKEIYEIVRIH